MEASSAKVGGIVMDDDTTTISKARREVSSTLEKHSDFNHTKKNLGNKLYELRKSHSDLSQKVIAYLQKCFAYAVRQHSGQPARLAQAIKQIVPHAFGHHDSCDPSWCGSKRADSTSVYRHKSLPYGRDLTGEDLKKSLTGLFDSYAEMSDSLSHLGSSNANENMNRCIAAKAPKALHYSGSQSLNFRIAGAVAQKNMGKKYLCEVR